MASICSSLLLLAVTAAHVGTSWIAAAGIAIAIPFVIVSHVQGRTYHRALEDRLLEWHREASGRPGATLADAIAAGRSSGDRRISDMAREISRRR